jgi:ankyrin repeat protein
MPDAMIFSADATRALFGAIGRGDVDAALRALEEGADPNGTEGDMRNSPLILCALYHKPLIAKALLEKGADPDYARPNGGETALMMTAFSNDRATAKLIVDAGANILKQSHFNQDAMMRACSESNREMAPLFRQWADERDKRIAAEKEAQEREAEQRRLHLELLEQQRQQNLADIISAAENGISQPITIRRPLKLGPGRTNV